jgi:glycosyltransferase involved in cell wall biosynthesis
MSAGAAAACQDYGQSQTLIQDGVNGVLAGNTHQWLAKLDWLVTHPAERRRLAQAGLQTVRAKYSREKCFQRLQQALEAVLAEDATVGR